MRYLYTVDGDWELELKIFGRVTTKEPKPIYATRFSLIRFRDINKFITFTEVQSSVLSGGQQHSRLIITGGSALYAVLDQYDKLRPDLVGGAMAIFSLCTATSD